MAVYQALAQYERHLSEEWAKDEDGLYWGFHRVFYGSAVESLDPFVKQDGWPWLLDVLEAYSPNATYEFETYPEHEDFGGAERGDFEEYPHIGHVLATVTGKQLVRTRRADDVEAIPADALDYLLEFHRHPSECLHAMAGPDYPMVEAQKTTPIPRTILRDTREQRPWEFEEFPVETHDVTLSTGDYAVPTHCVHDSEADTYRPQFAVERKSGHDFLTSLTWERERFKRELQRAARWTQPLPVVVETSWRTVLCNHGRMALRDVHPNQVIGTVAAWTNHYNVAFHFTETRQQAELCAFLLLVRHSLVRRLDDSPLGTNDAEQDTGL